MRTASGLVTCTFFLNFLILTICDEQLKSMRRTALFSLLRQRNPQPLIQNDTKNFPVTRTRRAESEDSSEEDTFNKDDIGWSNINEEVDMVIPMVLQHLQEIGIEFLDLPDLKETITLNPLFITYETGIILSNGIVYNLSGVRRYGNAYMTYEGKSFTCRFYLQIQKLQFEYNFLLKLMALEGYGKVIGSLDDTIVYAELAINISSLGLKLNDFRVMNFRNIQVQLDQIRIIRELTGLILSPITNLFRDRITTSISDGLKDQMQTLMNDFNGKDPLELRSFTKKLLAGLLGNPKSPSPAKEVSKID